MNWIDYAARELTREFQLVSAYRYVCMRMNLYVAYDITSLNAVYSV